MDLSINIRPTSLPPWHEPKADQLDARLVQGNINLNFETCRVMRGRRIVDLARKEFLILACLLEHPDRILSRGELKAIVWGEAAPIEERSIDVYVARLRKRLSNGRERDPIRTVRGLGYIFDVPLK